MRFIVRFAFVCLLLYVLISVTTGTQSFVRAGIHEPPLTVHRFNDLVVIERGSDWNSWTRHLSMGFLEPPLFGSGDVSLGVPSPLREREVFYLALLGLAAGLFFVSRVRRKRERRREGRRERRAADHRRSHSKTREEIERELDMIESLDGIMSRIERRIEKLETVFIK